MQVKINCYVLYIELLLTLTRLALAYFTTVIWQLGHLLLVVMKGVYPLTLALENQMFEVIELHALLFLAHKHLSGDSLSLCFSPSLVGWYFL